ncbi:unnamed protein product [Cylindrotheca closterium]|uniref:Uncharacterized protein n=1 Tax=Cylindrotheca closterium TaxID=2856 RepID=A0AAD2FCB5_9STRA|nr:unnamed protein product [Cylindrotheca closterium]
MVTKQQYQSGQYVAAASPKYQQTTREPQPTNNVYVEGREDIESRDGTTALMASDHSTIRTRDDISLPIRHTPGNLPGWAPALAAQKPPVVIEATAARGSSQKTPRRNAEPMDFMQSDNSFQIVASLIVDKFEEALKNRADHIIVTQDMKDEIERVMPEDAKENFVAALRFRLAEAPEFSRLPMHTVTRNCHKLGMTRLDEQNILFAPIGTTIKLDIPPDTTKSTASVRSSRSTRSTPRGVDNSDVRSVTSRATTAVEEESPESMARQQLLAELQEASALMAESVTPEAAQFWKKQVVELQNKLKALQQSEAEERSVASKSVHTANTANTAQLLKENERLIASLKQGKGYVEPTMADYVPPFTPTGHISETPKVNPNTFPTVEVVAPADLPGGYMFEAEIHNKRFLATVPDGGVKSGQTFTSTMQDIKKKTVGIPSGRWRDGLMDIFKHGKTHPLVVYSFLCPPIALAQIMTRMGFDFRGKPANVPEKGFYSTWGTILSILFMWGFTNYIVLDQLSAKAATGAVLSFFDSFSLYVVNGGLIAYVVYATANCRASIREYSGIEENPLYVGPRKFTRGQDYLLSAFAMPFVIAQMGRHTASYDNFEGSFCSHHGLSRKMSVADVLTCNNPTMLGCDNPYTEIGAVV